MGRVESGATLPRSGTDAAHAGTKLEVRADAQLVKL
jgi:hypothetical protein